MYNICVVAFFEQKINTSLIKHNGTMSPKSFESRLCFRPRVQTSVVDSTEIAPFSERFN
jgi:hypothetical protein